jgi:hypothetical protein
MPFGHTSPASFGGTLPRGEGFAGRLNDHLPQQQSHRKTAKSSRFPGSFLKSGNADSCHHQAAVIQGILAGGQADQLVAVDRGNAGIIERQFLALGDKVIELADGSQTWDLTTPEALYDYIVNVCN